MSAARIWTHNLQHQSTDKTKILPHTGIEETILKTVSILFFIFFFLFIF